VKTVIVKAIREGLSYRRLAAMQRHDFGQRKMRNKAGKAFQQQRKKACKCA
jgi:hypothetical protein